MPMVEVDRKSTTSAYVGVAKPVSWVWLVGGGLALVTATGFIIKVLQPKK